MTRLRAPLAVAVVAAVSWLGFGVVAGPLGRFLDAALSSDGVDALALDLVLAGGCAAALAACWLWLATGVLVLMVDEVLTGGALGALLARRSLPWPPLVRGLALFALGVAATATPAAADGPPPADVRSHDRVIGLTLPDRVPTRRPTTRVLVRPGDSLWSIAAAQLGSEATDPAVDRAWRRLAQANASRIGPDPDLIFPGVVLVVPDLGSTLGKESS